MNSVTDTTTLPLIPSDMAPSLVDRLQRLLAEVPTTVAPALVFDSRYRGPRCVVCHEGGKLSGHRRDDGQLEWIHKKCHRQLRRRGRPHGHVVTKHRGAGRGVLRGRRSAH